MILHQSCFSLKSDHQDLLRSFTFTVPQRRNDLHLTSSEEPLFLTFTFTFMHLADAFIQSDLHCIQVTVYQLLLSLGIEPMILALLAPCSTIWATGKPHMISSSLNQHCIISLDHLHLILLRHIIGDIKWPLIFRSFYVSICCTVIKISLIYITTIRISSYKYQHLQKIHIYAQFVSLNKTELFFPPYSHYIRLYEP